MGCTTMIQEPRPAAPQIGIVGGKAQQPQGHMAQGSCIDIAGTAGVEWPSAVVILVVLEIVDEVPLDIRVEWLINDARCGDKRRQQENRPAIIAAPAAIRRLRRLQLCSARVMASDVSLC